MLSASMLLNVWEQGYGRPAALKGLLLLSAGWPNAPAEELAALHIGQRDSRLLALREQLFGPRLNSMITCDNCGERLEISFKVDDIRTGDAGEETGELAVDVAGYRARFRLPDSTDLLALENGLSPGGLKNQLLHRCFLEAIHEGAAVAVDDLSAEVVSAISESMALADPQADVEVNLVCPACEHAWSAIFDVVSYLWQEIDSWAIRTLRDVHRLASTYGWHERDILSMSTWRRQLYLQMVGG